MKTASMMTSAELKSHAAPKGGAKAGAANNGPSKLVGSGSSGSPVWVWSERNQCWNLKDGQHSHATVWPDGTWHTWNRDGVGGENDVCKYSEYMPFDNRHHAAKREAWASCERQGFILENT